MALAAWFSVATLSRAFAHECASQSHSAAAVSISQSPAESHESHSAHDAGGAGKETTDHECDCLSTCCIPTVPQLVAEHAVPAAVEIVAVMPIAGELDLRPATSAFVLPFAIGPPAFLNT